MHTLKGAARVFGFHEIQDIAHRIEDVFEAIGGKRPFSTLLMAEKIFRGLDAIRSILERIVQEKEMIGHRCLGRMQGPRRVPSGDERDPDAEEK